MVFHFMSGAPVDFPTALHRPRSRLHEGLHFRRSLSVYVSGITSFLPADGFLIASGGWNVYWEPRPTIDATEGNYYYNGFCWQWMNVYDAVPFGNEAIQFNPRHFWISSPEPYTIDSFTREMRLAWGRSEIEEGHQFRTTREAGLE